MYAIRSYYAYVFEYDVNVTRNGDYADGPATIQCQYAPAFSGRSEGRHLELWPGRIDSIDFEQGGIGFYKVFAREVGAAEYALLAGKFFSYNFV